MSNLDAIPEMKQVDDYLSGKVFRDKQTVPQVELHEPLFAGFTAKEAATNASKNAAKYSGVTVQQFARNVEQQMGERAAENADFYRDMERELDCA